MRRGEGPVATLYRQAAGVTVFQITMIESICLALAVGCELPWGIVADRIGYRRTMIVCCGLYFVSKLVLWRAEGFGGFLMDVTAIFTNLAFGKTAEIHLPLAMLLGCGLCVVGFGLYTAGESLAHG